MMNKVIICIGLLASTVSMAQKSEKFEIPFTLDRNLILIQATIEKTKTSNFIFDTGTEGIMLLDSIANSFESAGLDTIVTPNGDFVGTQEKVRLPEIKFGMLSLKNKNANKMARQMLFSNQAVGIIGMQTFMGYMITIDYKNGKIILEKGSLLNQKNVIPINLDHLLEAKVKLNNKAVLAHFDCGGAGYISIPKKWDSLYQLKSEPVFFTKGRTPMGDFDVYKAELDCDIEVGHYNISKPRVSLVTGDFFYSINFGYEFFKLHLITIDTKNKLLYIKN